MKMPATTATKVEAKPSTDLVGDATKQCLNCLEKKVRNLEKRKGKIEVNREKAEKGTKLEKEQEISLNQYEQVTHDLEFARELHKQFLTINSEHEKMVKKQAKREKMERQTIEIKRVSEILQLQSTLDMLGGDKVREDFKTGKHGAVVLTEDNLDQLDQLYQAISPSRDDSGDQYPQKLTAAAEHLVNILDGKDRQVLGTTYKELKELLTLINQCGYFESAKQASSDVEEVEEAEEASGEAAVEQAQAAENLSEDTNATTDDQEESSPEPTQQQQPIDLTTSTTEGVKSHLDMPAQPMNTLEQDAFFAPSSTPTYPNEPSPAAPYSQQQQPQTGQDFQSFTHNRPIQFIQASYMMSEPQQAPSVVDPAVIHAQPAGGPAANLAFMQPAPASFVDSGSSAQSSAQPSSQQPAQSQPPSQAGSGLSQSSLSNSSSNATVAATQQPQGASQEFAAAAAQSFGQPTALPQNLQSEGLFATEEVSNSLSSHQAIMGQMRGAEDGSNSFEIPPSIPMPPSQQGQDQSQLEQQQQQQQQQQLEDKKFQMNASAPVFQSMYAQQVAAGGVPVTMPPPAVSADTPATAGDFNAQNASADFQQGYQGNNGFNNNMYSRNGGRGNYRGGSRNGGGSAGGPNTGVRNGSGGAAVQNGFGGGRPGGPMTNNNRGGGRGGYGYGTNPYRQDNYQNYNAGGFSNYQKRGGMTNPGGPPNMGNTGYSSRGGSGGMRGGMPRGGQRGGGMRGGGFNRPPPTQ